MIAYRCGDLDFVLLAAIAGGLGDHTRAVRTSGAIDAFSQLVDVVPTPLVESISQEIVSAAQMRCHRQRYAAAWKDGGALSLDEAVQAGKLRWQLLPKRQACTGRGGSRCVVVMIDVRLAAGVRIQHSAAATRGARRRYSGHPQGDLRHDAARRS